MFAQKTRWLFAGWVGGCAGRGYLCVAMEPTQVDNCSNDCGGRAEAARHRGKRVASGERLWLDVSQLLCLSVTRARGVDWSILCGIKVQGSFQL